MITENCKGCIEDIPAKFRICEYDGFILNHAIQDKSQNMWPYELGHLVLMPRKRKETVMALDHATDTTNLTEPELKGICELLPKILHAMEKILPNIRGDKVERIYLATFNEDEKWHFHIHLVPRYKCEPRRGTALLTPRIVLDEDIDKVVKEMKRELGCNSQVANKD